MSDWVLALTPLLVLPIFLLFRFIGCDKVVGLEPVHFTPYDELVGKDPNLVAYWRLGDQNSAPQAADQKGANPGYYGQPPATSGSGPSQGGTGEALQGQPGLIGDDKNATSVDFEGGYVVVPFADGVLNTPTFTVEAWVLPGAWQPGFTHAIVTAAETVAGVNRGFSIYARWNAAMQQVFWSASVGTGSIFVELTGPVVAPATKAYFALTYDGTTATLFVATALDKWDAVQPVLVSGYLPIQANGLYIGANNLTPPPPLPPPPPQPAPPVDYPFIGQIQEVALYNAPLSQTTLESHRKSN